MWFNSKAIFLPHYQRNSSFSYLKDIFLQFLCIVTWNFKYRAWTGKLFHKKLLWKNTISFCIISTSFKENFNLYLESKIAVTIQLQGLLCCAAPQATEPEHWFFLSFQRCKENTGAYKQTSLPEAQAVTGWGRTLITIQRECSEQ